jgi:hypothetical protein
MSTQLSPYVTPAACQTAAGCGFPRADSGARRLFRDEFSPVRPDVPFDGRLVVGFVKQAVQLGQRGNLARLDILGEQLGRIVGMVRQLSRFFL